MYITRKIEQTILQYLGSPEIIAVVGPRQSGKTTLLRHIFDTLGRKAVFLTFEDNKVLNMFVRETDLFIEQYVKPYQYVFIDEFNYAKKGGKILKYIIDTVGRKIFISGSSSVDLSVQAVKYLVGRIFVFSLFQFDFEEYLSFRDRDLYAAYGRHRLDLEHIKENAPVPLPDEMMEKFRLYYGEYAVYGGYPRVVISKTTEEKKVVLKNIYNTYFLREVKDILGLVDDYKLAQLIKALALQIGGLIEYGEISRVSELSFQTVKSYINFLQKTFVCSFVKPYFTNKRTEIVKNPKPYFFDAGLRNYIVDDFRDIDRRPDGGHLLENAVAMELIKREKTFRFWRNKQKAEVDFVVDLHEGKKIALEVKQRLGSADLRSRSALDFMRSYPDIYLLFCSYLGKPDVNNSTAFIGLL